ncbi:MAG TPA: autotransporter-associated beta strand repeat-containing protein, partial [Chthoniobacter sp.]
MQWVRGQTWTGATSFDWNTASNWNPAVIPNGDSATATFDTATVLGISISANTEVNGIVFTANAVLPSTITVSSAWTLTLSGDGIINNSGVSQGVITAVDANGNYGTVDFSNEANAGTETQITNDGGIVSGGGGGQTVFQGNSSAGGAVIFNQGAAVNGAGGGTTIFQGTASAGSAIITTNGGSNGGAGGATYFVANADGGTAQAITNGNGVFDISGLSNVGMNIGSIAGSGTYYLGGNTLTTGGNNMSTTVSGVISDRGSAGGTGGSLVLTGTGTLILSGANSYTGTTSIINGATLQANVAGALPAPVSDGGAGTVRTAVLMDQTGIGGSNLVLGASQAIASLTGAALSQVNLNANTLTIGSPNAAMSTEFDGVISDENLGGSLIKDGASTQILAGANTYIGSTTVKGGTLVVDGSLAAGSSVFVQNGAVLSGFGNVAGTVNILSGGVLQPGTQAPDTLTVGTLILNPGSNANFRLQQSGIPGSQINDMVSVTSNLNLGGALNVEPLPGFGIGTYPLFTYSGILTNTGFSAINGLAGYTTSISTGTVGEVDLVVSLGTPQYWDGAGALNDGIIAGGNGTWGITTKNWTNAAGTTNAVWQGGTAILGTKAGTVTISGTINAQGLIFDITGYTIGGGTLGLTGSMPAVSVTNQADSATISAKVTGTSGLNVKGAGLLTLTNSANTYSGGTNISTGTLEIGTNSIVGSIGGGDISVSSGGLLLLVSTVNNVLSNNVTNGVAGSGILNVQSTKTTTLTGTLTDGVAGQFLLTQGGTGTVILSNAGNSYSGTTTVVVGSLQIGTSTAAGSIGASSSVSVGDNGTLMLVNVVGNLLPNDVTNALGGTGLVSVNSTHTTTLGGILSDGLGTLNFTQSGLGTAVLSGESSYSGTTTVSAGTLQVGNGTGGSLTGGGGITVTGSGTLALDLADGTSFTQAINLSVTTATLKMIQGGTTTVSGVISGTGGVTQSGMGTTILSAVNTYTGPTTISAGTLEVDGRLA